MMTATALCQERVVSVDRQANPPICVRANQTDMRVSRVLALHIAVGDEIVFPIPTGDEVGGEVSITKHAVSRGHPHHVYQAPIGYVTQPKVDKRSQHFVTAEVRQSGLGISAIFLPCQALRDYLYRLRGAAGQNHQPDFYQALRIPKSASPAELRLAYRLRTLELNSESGRELLPLEQAFNILAQPDLRACYDALLVDPESPVVFPHGGFGSPLVSGEQSRDGQTFFANRILAFSPERKHRRFQLPLRQCDFYEHRALCRDVHRKLECWLDPALLHIHWDPTWNQWKHLLPTKIEVNATFVQYGKFRTHNGGRELVCWETALPSRLVIQTPCNIEQQLESAKTAYQAFRALFARAGADPIVPGTSRH